MTFVVLVSLLVAVGVLVMHQGAAPAHASAVHGSLGMVTASASLHSTGDMDSGSAAHHDCTGDMGDSASRPCCSGSSPCAAVVETFRLPTPSAAVWAPRGERVTVSRTAETST